MKRELEKKLRQQKQWNSRANRRASRRNGSVSVLMACSMTFILGCAALAVDYGLLVADANRLQRACDAGALAGAMKLKQTGIDITDEYNAKIEAQTVALQNGVAVNFNDITITNNGTRIRVPGATTRAFFFGRAIGVNSKGITRAATAGVTAGDELSTAPGNVRVAPIGITWETYLAYKDDRLLSHDIELVRQNKQIFTLNDMVLFDLREQNSKSGAQMQDQLTGARIETSAIGDYETTLNAAQSSEKKKLEDGLQILFDRSEAAPWNDSDDAGTKYNDILSGASPRNNPRVVYLIVTPSTTNPSNGTFNTQVQGFAPVYIESYYQTNSLGEQVLRMRVRFLPPGTASDGQVTPNPNGSLAGVRVIGLTD
ncbi:MAG TPA: Tad domain-containing protein [Abditibacteriaceae bacterium]|jgi:Flp pilus assembly protein TadG